MTTPIVPPPVPALIAPHSRLAPAPRGRYSLDLPYFLLALAEVESGNNPWAIGKRGELGVYQFRETTWYMHTRAPFYRAKDAKFAATIAAEHVGLIERALRSVNLDPDARNVALCWNAGIRAVMQGRCPLNSVNYADRVANLYADALLRRERKISVKIQRPSAAAK